jgi:serpin B
MVPLTGFLTYGLVVLGLAVQTQGVKPGVTYSPEAREAMAGIVHANNLWGLDLLSRLRQQEGNLFFSPYGVSTAMALTYAGARNWTADQTARTLHWCDEQSRPWPPTFLAPSLGLVVADQNRRASEGSYELITANALWGQKDTPFLLDFLQTIESHYDGKLNAVDFSRDPETARVTINAWIEDRTGRRIQDLIPKAMLNAMTRLAVTSAVYFKGDWAISFSRARTTQRPFSMANGQIVSVPLMVQTGQLPYAENNDLQVLEIPYAGGLSMVIFLPKEVGGLAKVEQGMTPVSVSGWLQDTRSREVLALVPRFRLAGQFSLADTLKGMGLTGAFSMASDFSGMTGRRDVFISAVAHKAVIVVDEKGVEGAPPAGAGTGRARVQPIVFRADHPFIFLIRDRVSGIILFIGRLSEPRQGNG